MKQKRSEQERLAKLEEQMTQLNDRLSLLLQPAIRPKPSPIRCEPLYLLSVEGPRIQEVGDRDLMIDFTEVLVNKDARAKFKVWGCVEQEGLHINLLRGEGTDSLVQVDPVVGEGDTAIPLPSSDKSENVSLLEIELTYHPEDIGPLADAKVYMQTNYSNQHVGVGINLIGECVNAFSPGAISVFMGISSNHLYKNWISSASPRAILTVRNTGLVVLYGFSLRLLAYSGRFKLCCPDARGSGSMKLSDLVLDVNDSVEVEVVYEGCSQEGRCRIEAYLSSDTKRVISHIEVFGYDLRCAPVVD